MRIIRGVVTDNGAVLTGNGYTVSHGATGSGLYTITFTTPFNGLPAVTATATGDGQVISTFGVTSSFASFQIRAEVGCGGCIDDVQFNFIAIGPR